MVFSKISKKIKKTVAGKSSRRESSSSGGSKKFAYQDNEKNGSVGSTTYYESDASSEAFETSSSRSFKPRRGSLKKEASSRIRQNTDPTVILGGGSSSSYFEEEESEEDISKYQYGEESTYCPVETKKQLEKRPKRSSLKSVSSYGDLEEVAAAAVASQKGDSSPVKKVSSCNELESIVTPSSPPPKHRRSVDFSSDHDYKPIMPLEHFTEEEKKNTWMCHRSMDEAKKNAVRTVQTYERLGNAEGKLCTRGLEQYFSRNAHRRERNVDTIEEVLTEQEIQAQFGTYCADSLAAAYKSCGNTSESQFRAELTAKKDRAEVLKYLEEHPEMMKYLKAEHDNDDHLLM